jgi:transcriptional regulator with XRE-family HTH domain
MSTISASLATLLATARGRKGLSLRQVETATGVSNAYLSQLEGGRRVKEPSPVMLHKLSELYAIPYAQLMRAAGYPVPSADGPADTVTTIAARLGPTTPQEEDALVDYLRFLRSRDEGRKR